MMDCPHCGADVVIEGARRCVDCGGSLLPLDRPATAADARAGVERINCPHCGAESSADALICGACHRELITVSVPGLRGERLRRGLVALVAIGAERRERQRAEAAPDGAGGADAEELAVYRQDKVMLLTLVVIFLVVFLLITTLS